MYTKTHKKRILFVAMILITAFGVVTMILLALSRNLDLFYTPSEITQGVAPEATTIRIGGMVVNDSVVRGEGLKVKFKLTDFEHEVIVTYEGILPDLFREGQGIVTRGQWLEGQYFKAIEVLAKHDENYMPKEVSHALGVANDT